MGGGPARIRGGGDRSGLPHPPYRGAPLSPRGWIPRGLGMPALFVVSDLNLPVEIEKGVEITIFVKVSNVGEVEGTYKVDLTVEGEVVYSESVTLSGGETKEVPLWIVEGLSEGAYHVEVNGLEGSFEVVCAARLVGGGVTNLLPQAILSMILLIVLLLISFLLIKRLVVAR